MTWNFSPQIEPNFCERQFFKEVMNKLYHLDDNYNFIITNYDDNNLSLFKPNKINIVIYVSDEYGISKTWFNKVDLIFRTYPIKGHFDNIKIFPIPLGLVMPDFVTYKIEKPKKKLSERKYDCFYSGQPSPNRVLFTDSIKKSLSGSNLKGIYRETTGFRTGFSIDDYFKIMNETKISLVPLGKVLPESFRYMESFESECVVVSDFPFENYKDIWYYKESPAIFIKNYNDINLKFIEQILNNIDSYQERNKNYYNDFLSTNAVSKFIINIINEKIV